MPTKIQWTNETWNPVTGCTNISAGCKYCYAERMARRLAGRHGYPEAPHHFDVTLRPARLEEPLTWRKPRMVFVCSMSDLFHDHIPTEYIRNVFQVMGKAKEHTFQVLTKRPERMFHFVSEYIVNRVGQPDPFPNIWLGVTTENQVEFGKRVSWLNKTPAVIRFISYEPALGPLNAREFLYDGGIPVPWQSNGSNHWVIAGGESGHGARAPRPEWFRSLRDDCIEAGVPFFFKQWGGPHHNGWVIDGNPYQGETLDGETIQQFPTLPEPTEIPL